jgi:hypothetical protein
MVPRSVSILYPHGLCRSLKIGWGPLWGMSLRQGVRQLPAGPALTRRNLAAGLTTDTQWNSNDDSELQVGYQGLIMTSKLDLTTELGRRRDVVLA